MGVVLEKIELDGSGKESVEVVVVPYPLTPPFQMATSAFPDFDAIFKRATATDRGSRVESVWQGTATGFGLPPVTGGAGEAPEEAVESTYDYSTDEEEYADMPPLVPAEPSKPRVPVARLPSVDPSWNTSVQSTFEEMWKERQKENYTEKHKTLVHGLLAKIFNDRGDDIMNEFLLKIQSATSPSDLRMEIWRYKDAKTWSGEKRPFLATSGDWFQNGIQDYFDAEGLVDYCEGSRLTVDEVWRRSNLPKLLREKFGSKFWVRRKFEDVTHVRNLTTGTLDGATSTVVLMLEFWPNGVPEKRKGY